MKGAQKSMGVKKPKMTSIGGQALIEGIMMKGPDRTVMAVRNPQKEIILEDVKSKPVSQRAAILKVPLIRGVAGFIDSMIVGYKTLMRSAEIAGFTDDEEDHAPEQADETAEVTETEGTAPPEEKKSNGKLMGFVMIFASVLGLALAVVLFMWLPAFLFNLLKAQVGEQIANYRALFEGVLKILIFLAYLILVSRMKDIRRVFEYHGAEHKSIFCYEAGEELTVENIKKQSRFHPRCGTSFLLTMLIVGIFVTFLVSYFTTLDDNLYIWTPMKILIVPVIMALGYEVLRFTGRHNNWFTRMMATPGLWMQRLTTKEPDASQIEVAIKALTAVIPENQNQDKW